jgi:hypothetical protein
MDQPLDLETPLFFAPTSNLNDIIIVDCRSAGRPLPLPFVILQGTSERLSSMVVQKIQLFISIIVLLKANCAKDDDWRILPSENKPSLNMTLWTDKCTGDCKSYITPVSECYNSGDLFPNDPSWSGLDVLDTVICQTLIRTIFHTSDSSCTTSDSDDRFKIPLDECVGPFGQPRPWGSFSLLSSDLGGHLVEDC